MKAHAIIVMIPTAAILLFIAIGSGQTGTVEDCSSCHFGSRPEGNYRFVRPEMSIMVPDNVTEGSTFQVLVRIAEREKYELVLPKATIDLAGLSAAKADRDEVQLEPIDGAWKGVFTVKAGHEGPARIVIEVSMLVHYDHPEDEDPDLYLIELSGSKDLDIGREAGTGPVESKDDARETPLGSSLVFGGTLLFGLISWGERTMTARRR